jgi:SET domain
MITNPSISPSRLHISSHGCLDVCENTATGHKSMHTTASFQPGDVISKFSAGAILRTPTYLTVQTGDDTHITLQPEYLQYINHGCNPNVFFDTTSFLLVCLRPLEPGDELTFFYPSTEWNMVQPFSCFCESSNCLRHIQGASYLSNETLSKYRLTDFIKGKLKNR